MDQDPKKRARLRRVDEIFRRFLAAMRAKLTLADDDLLHRAERSAQGTPCEPATRSPDPAS